MSNIHLRRFALSGLILLLITLSSGVNAKSYRIGISAWSGYPESILGFKAGLGEAGLVEGENLEFLYRESGGDRTRQREIAGEFKSAGVDLVHSLTTPGTIIVKEVMPEQTPIVFSIVTYPADSGLIESFEYSANNLVGTSNYVPLRHYLSLLRQLMPRARTAAIFHRKGEPNSKIQAAGMIRLLEKAGLQVLDRQPTSVDEVREMARHLLGKADIYITTTDTLMQGGGEAALLETSLSQGIPILSSNKAGIEQGSTFGPVADFFTLGKMSGVKAAMILQESVAPAKLESELQNPPLVLVNRSSARQLGVKVPDALLTNIRWVE